MEERKGVTWNVNHPVQHPVLQFRASSFKRNKLLFLPEGSIASFVSVSIAIVNTMFTRESMFPSLRMGGGKKITPKMTDANGWNAWLSISARKLRFDDRREREGKKTIEKDACQIANMHMQHHARSLIVVRSDALSFNRASSSSICTRKVLFYELYRANFDTSKWYAPRARIHEAKPFKPSGCNAPITCAHREKERERERREERGGGKKKEREVTGSPVNFNWLHRGVLGPIHRISDMQMQFNDAISCT